MTTPLADPAPDLGGSPPYGWAAAVTVAILAIYVVTLGPTTAFWDTPEYIAAAKVLGIPHPPGNPLFVVLAHVFGLLPLAASYAERINLFAAVTSSLAAGLWFLVAERWLRSILPWRGARLAAAFAGILVGATAWTVWNQSTVNEKVYTVSLLSIALVMWLAVHWADDRSGSHRDRWLIMIGYVLTLSSTNHMMGVLVAPAVALYVIWTDWREAVRPWVLLLGWMTLVAVTGVWTGAVSGETAGIAALAVALGLLVWAVSKDPRSWMPWLVVLAVVVGVSLNYVFLPLRAGQFPAINEGEPTSWNALLDVLNRAQYGKPSVMLRQADLVGQFANYWQYWTWQFARDWPGLSRVATAFFTLLGVGGLLTLIKRDRRAGVAALVLFGTLTILLVFYLNFKYGFSMYPDRPSLPREVRERDYFFVASFAFFGTLLALGFGAVIRWLAEAIGDGLGKTAAQAWPLATPVLLLAFIPLVGNRLTASRAHETTPRDFAVDLLESVEPYGILITAGDNDTFPLWFAQEVLGVRRDVTLANLSLMNTEWHLKQISRRQTPPFDSASAASVWQEMADQIGPPPPRPALDLPEDEIDSLPEVMRAPEGTNGLRFGDITLRFASDILMRADLATIFLIRDNLATRPIFFAWSAAGYPDETLGLTPYLVTHGLVRKLNPTPIVGDSSVVMSPGLGWVDVERSRKLLFETYHWESAARDRPRGWVDQPSRSILSLYSVVYGGLADTFAMLGDSTASARADSIGAAVQRGLAPRR